MGSVGGGRSPTASPKNSLPVDLRAFLPQTERMGTRRAVSIAIATGLIAYGLWLARADHEYRNTILWLGGGAGLAGFTAGCIAATSRRRYLWALAAGAVLVAGWLAVLLGWAYAENTLTWSSCSRDCAGPDPYAALVFVYLANLVGWTIGATLGLGARESG
jgi:hypothetical protein